MKREKKVNKYTVYSEIVFVNKADVYASNEKEARRKAKEIIEGIEEENRKLIVSDNFYRIRSVELQEKNIRKERTVMFVYEDEF